MARETGRSVFSIKRVLKSFTVPRGGSGDRQASSAAHACLRASARSSSAISSKDASAFASKPRLTSASTKPQEFAARSRACGRAGVLAASDAIRQASAKSALDARPSGSGAQTPPGWQTRASRPVPFLLFTALLLTRPLDMMRSVSAQRRGVLATAATATSASMGSKASSRRHVRGRRRSVAAAKSQRAPSVSVSEYGDRDYGAGTPVL